MAGRFDGEVALVTGAAGAGIGQATARRLAADGATVIVTDVHERRTGEVADAMKAEGLAAIGHVLDAGDRDRIDVVLAAVADEVGPVTILVNNAAINPLNPTVDLSVEDWNRTIDVDLTGPWYLTKQVLPAMIAAGKGSIINVTSTAGFTGTLDEGPYAASKSALHCLSRTVAREVGPHGVRCNSVAPGLVWTKFMERYEEQFRPEVERTALRRFGTPEDVADVIAFLASDDARFITGEILNVSGGWYMRP